jgi:hypothetical protein
MGRVGDKLGPAMAALPNDRWRRFVTELFSGCTNTIAAERAGFRGTQNSLYVTASRLVREPRIKRAIREESEHYLTGNVGLASSVIAGIARNPAAKNRDRLHAAERLMDQAGLGVRQQHDYNITVTDDAQLIREIRAMAQTLGLDAQALLGNAGVTIEHEDEPK